MVFSFFETPKKKVTKTEWEEIRLRLYRKLDEHDRDDVETLFRADLHEEGVEAGISRPEYESAIAWLKQNTNKHHLEVDDIAFIEGLFAEHLKD